MNHFFKSFFASLLAFFVFIFLGFILLFAIIGALSSKEEVVVPANSVLVIDLSENFPEQVKEDAYTELLNKKKGKTPSLSDLVYLIQYAKSAKTIIVLLFILSIAYNLVGMYFATQALLSPMVAAILMPISSISIVAISALLSYRYAKSILG